MPGAITRAMTVGLMMGAGQTMEIGPTSSSRPTDYRFPIPESTGNSSLAMVSSAMVSTFNGNSSLFDSLRSDPFASIVFTLGMLAIVHCLYTLVAFIQKMITDKKVTSHEKLQDGTDDDGFQVIKDLPKNIAKSEEVYRCPDSVS